jgi:hypothetical protein
MKRLIRRCYATKTPLFMHGTTGIGKSMLGRDVFMEVAQEVKREFIDWSKADEEKKKDIWDNCGKYLVFVDDRVALKDTTDNKGIPNMKETNGVAHLKWIKTLIMNLSAKKDAMVIWFKDEFNLAAPMVQTAEYQIVLDNALDDLAFNDNTFVFAAGNRQEDRANVFELPNPLKNRFSHATLVIPDIDTWIDWALKNQVDSRVVGYLHFKPSFLFKMDNMSKDNAFATPRSWAMCSKMISGLTNEDELEESISSCVGEGIALEMVSWIKLQATIDIEGVLDEPERVKEIKGSDLKHTLVTGITEKYKTDPEKYMSKVFGVSLVLQPEFATLQLRMIKAVNPTLFVQKAPRTQGYSELVKKYVKYMRD